MPSGMPGSAYAPPPPREMEPPARAGVKTVPNSRRHANTRRKCIRKPGQECRKVLKPSPRLQPLPRIACGRAGLALYTLPARSLLPARAQQKSTPVKRKCFFNFLEVRSPRQGSQAGQAAQTSKPGCQLPPEFCLYSLDSRLPALIRLLRLSGYPDNPPACRPGQLHQAQPPGRSRQQRSAIPWISRQDAGKEGRTR